MKHRTMNSLERGGYSKELNSIIMNRAKAFRKDLISKCTSAEKNFRSFLDRNFIKYEFQKVIYIRDLVGNIQKFYIADFYLPDIKLIIEVDGEYHKEASQTEADLNREIAIKRAYPNINILRIDNERTSDPSYIEGLIEGYKKTKELT